MRSKPFVCLSSKHVIQMLSSCDVCRNACLYKFDVKDFFMDGDHSVIVESCGCVVSEALSNGICFPGHAGEDFDVTVFKEVLTFLLDSQYVDTNMGNVWHKVVRGTGMGNKHSASVSSSNFYYIAERNVVDSAEGLEANGVSLYLRYHDDIFVLLLQNQPWQGDSFLTSYS